MTGKYCEMHRTIALRELGRRQHRRDEKGKWLTANWPVLGISGEQDSFYRKVVLLTGFGVLEIKQKVWYIKAFDFGIYRRHHLKIRQNDSASGNFKINMPAARILITYAFFRYISLKVFKIFFQNVLDHYLHFWKF